LASYLSGNTSGPEPRLNGHAPERLDSPSSGGALSILRDIGATIAVAKDMKRLSKAGRELLTRAEDAARENPAPLLVAAFGIGVLATLLLMKSPRTRR
jgi:hypothetical protein